MPAPDAAAAEKDDVPALDISLTSSDPDAVFVLAAGGKPLCTSPCKHRVRVDDLVTVKELREGKVKEITLDNLRNYAPAGGIDVTATPRSGSEFTGGVVLAGLGGAGLLAGIVTLFIGGRERNDVTREVEPNTGAMVAGGVVLAAGAAAIPIGVVLIVGHGESVEIKPAQGVTLSIGPGILFGSF